MRVAALVKNPDHVCCRYRLTAFRPQLQAAGHTLTYCGWTGSWRSTLRLRRTLAAADAVVVQRLLLSAPHWHLVRRFSQRLIFDFDDAVFCRDSYARRGIECPYKRRRFERVVRSADAVVAGNAFLAAEAARSAGAEKVHVIPTCVDVDRYPLALHHDANHLRLVWIGSSSTLRGLEVARDLLDRIGRGVPGTSLKVVCDRAFATPGLPTVFCPWSERTEAEELAAADVGISWIPDDRWSRGKCGLKILQYMAAGLPVVTNPVGMHPRRVEHGVTGFLAATVQEWVDAVHTLAHDPELRRRMGAAGRSKVEAECSVRQGAALWTELLGSLEGRARSAA